MQSMKHKLILLLISICIEGYSQENHLVKKKDYWANGNIKLISYHDENYKFIFL